MDFQEFFIQFQDHLAPKLDTYEQAIYLYIFRHSRLLGQVDVTIGFKSARSRMATGIGENGKPMSEGTAYVKLASLQAKGCITSIRTNHTGRVLRLHLPSEIPGVIPEPVLEAKQDLEAMDFFTTLKTGLCSYGARITVVSTLFSNLMRIISLLNTLSLVPLEIIAIETALPLLARPITKKVRLPPKISCAAFSGKATSTKRSSKIGSWHLPSSRLVSFSHR